MKLNWAMALDWRMRRHFGAEQRERRIDQVVDQALGIPAHPAANAELSIRMRQGCSKAGEVGAALERGTLFRSYAYRGGTYLFTPTGAAMMLALRAESQLWRKADWQQHYGLLPDTWDRFRSAVRDALRDGPLTRSELGAALGSDPRLRHLASSAFDGSDVLIKPLHWLGDISFGPDRDGDGEATFQLLADQPRWPGLAEFEAAGRQAVAACIGAYAPATMAHLDHCLSDGLGVRRQAIRRWLDALADRLATVVLDGETAYVMNDDLEALASTRPARDVRLLPARDPWVMLPGTADAHIVPPGRRALVTRGAHLIICGGVLAGTWRIQGTEVVLQVFGEVGPVAAAELKAQTHRLSEILDRPLTARLAQAAPPNKAA